MHIAALNEALGRHSAPIRSGCTPATATATARITTTWLPRHPADHVPGACRRDHAALRESAPRARDRGLPRIRLPDGMVLIPGVIETTNNYLEHPKVVAERLVRAASCIGDKERIIAGADCGFGTMAGDTFTAEDVVWAKLASLAEGARIATETLWG